MTYFIGGDRIYYPVSALLIEFLILSVVESQDSYGYEISQTVKIVTDIKESTGQTVINCKDGDTNIQNSNLKDLELKTGLDDLVMQNTSCTNSQIDMSDGDIKASNIVFRGNNKMTSSLGDITLGISEENLKDLSIQAETKLGDIKTRKSDKLGTITRNDDNVVLQSDEQNKNELEIQSSDGDITFR